MPDINGHFSVGKQNLHRPELSTAPWEVHWAEEYDLEIDL